MKLKLLLGFAMLMVGVTGLCQVKEAGSKGTIVGKWKFEVSNAPYSYQKGELVLKDENGLKGFFAFRDGQMLPVDNASFNADTLRIKAVVEYYEVNITLVLKDGMLTGSASTPEGEMPIAAKRTDE